MRHFGNRWSSGRAVASTDMTRKRRRVSGVSTNRNDALGRRHTHVGARRSRPFAESYVRSVREQGFVRCSGQVEKPAETLTHPRVLTGDVARKLELVEDTRDGRE